MVTSKPYMESSGKGAMPDRRIIPPPTLHITYVLKIEE